MRALPIISLILAGTLLAAPAMAQNRDWRENPGLQISGDARMGVIWTDRPDTPNTSRAKLISRARVKFRFAAETDGGTQFGFGFDAEKADARPRGQHVFIGN
ncbi:porin [Roseinatronobacter alkalisoli]|uniref:Porin n=1 Tax=Roseinatronobacter alkalisoli TaxID=3028235 RepID=A0ABT5T356_9RHOB|nr:porin [Roseinatronobacter sp. HJB301]MDD7969548.1 porin [Roseinatronobacter sp. HJB301]